MPPNLLFRQRGIPLRSQSLFVYRLITAVLSQEYATEMGCIANCSSHWCFEGDRGGGSSGSPVSPVAKTTGVGSLHAQAPEETPWPYLRSLLLQREKHPPSTGWDKWWWIS